MNLFEELKLAWQVRSGYLKAVAAAKQEDPVKSIFASKTFWLNILGVVAMVVPGIADKIPQPWGEVVLALLNIGNRFLTTGPVSLTGQPPTS